MADELKVPELDVPDFTVEKEDKPKRQKVQLTPESKESIKVEVAPPKEKPGPALSEKTLAEMKRGQESLAKRRRG